MKIRNIFLLAVLVRAIFIFSACDNWNSSDNQGSIVISFGNSKVRAAGDDAGSNAGSNANAPVSVYVEEADKIENYTITLTNPDNDDITKEINKSESVSIPVNAGKWSVVVNGEGDRVIIFGESEVDVEAGQSATVSITMNIIGTRVSSEEEIKADFVEINKGKDGKLAYLEAIEILDSFTISETVYDNGIILNSGNTVTLWSQKDVTLTRSEHNNRTDVQATVFRIDNGTLILDGTKGGEIIIDGNKENITSCKRALVNVMGKDSVLTITEGITLKNNKTELGGAIYVQQGTFRMEGGTISGNTASINGGGVYVENGVVTKTGGIIYGSDQEEDSLENKTPNHSGDAVYYNNKAHNKTSAADDITFAP